MAASPIPERARCKVVENNGNRERLVVADIQSLRIFFEASFPYEIQPYVSRTCMSPGARRLQLWHWPQRQERHADSERNRELEPDLYG
jgi:hypothetical protein